MFIRLVLEKIYSLTDKYSIKEIAYHGRVSYMTAYRYVSLRKSFINLEFIHNLETNGLINFNEIKGIDSCSYCGTSEMLCGFNGSGCEKEESRMRLV